MRGNKSTQTGPEKILQQILEKAGIQSFAMNDSELPGTPDFSFSNVMLAIFVHGCFWHRCTYCRPHFPESNPEYWTAKFRRNNARDVRVRRELRLRGWKPIVVWECQLKKRPRRVLTRIKKALEEANG